MRGRFLNFAIVGGGPTGIEFSGELRDLIYEDLSKLYPDLIKYVGISVYDVADKVLPMFDAKLSEYAMKHLAREGVNILTSHHITGLRKGAPGSTADGLGAYTRSHDSYTLTTEEEGDIGVGMCVWSTGLMMNPFIASRLDGVQPLPTSDASLHLRDTSLDSAKSLPWEVWKHSKSGGIMTDDHLRMLMKVKDSNADQDTRRAIVRDVFALGDCATMEGSMYPATAQVAQQKADWLAKRLNKRDIDSQAGFHWRNMGIMAYLGSWNAILQSSGGDISGRMAWIVWRGAYLTKAVSWRNKILIPVFWLINFLFGRDVTRF